MTILFWIFFVFQLSYYLKKNFDLFTLTFFTSTIYFLPAFFGFTHDASLPITLQPIPDELYFFYYYYFTLLWVLAELTVRSRKRMTGISGGQIQNTNIEAQISLLKNMNSVLRFASPALLAISYLIMGAALFSSDKQELLDNYTPFYALFETTTFIYVITAFACKRRLDFAIGLLYVIFDMYIGFRAIAAFILISLFAYSLILNFNKRKLVFFALALITAYAFASLYKIALLSYRLGAASAGLLTLLDLNNVYEALIITESFSVQGVFGTVIERKFSIPIEYSFEVIRIVFLGVGNFVFGKGLGFNDYFQKALFPHVPWGMGSNIWAEQYAIWGWPGPILLVLALFSLLFFLNNKALTWSAEGHVMKLLFAIYVVAPFFFYMHRNDLLFQLVLTRNSILVWGATYFFSNLLMRDFRKFLRRSL